MIVDVLCPEDDGDGLHDVHFVPRSFGIEVGDFFFSWIGDFPKVGLEFLELCRGLGGNGEDRSDYM